MYTWKFTSHIYRLKIRSNGKRVYKGFEAERTKRQTGKMERHTPVELELHPIVSSRPVFDAEGIS